MPTPKQMAWIVGLAAGTYFALERYKAKSAGASGSGRYGA